MTAAMMLWVLLASAPPIEDLPRPTQASEARRVRPALETCVKAAVRRGLIDGKVTFSVLVRSAQATAVSFPRPTGDRELEACIERTVRAVRYQLPHMSLGFSFLISRVESYIDAR